MPRTEGGGGVRKTGGDEDELQGQGLRGTAISREWHAIGGAGAFVVEFARGKLGARAARRHARAAVMVTRGS